MRRAFHFCFDNVLDGIGNTVLDGIGSEEMDRFTPKLVIGSSKAFAIVDSRE